MKPLSNFLASVIGQITSFTPLGGKLRLRRYQVEVAEVILDSILNLRGRSFVVMFPRQSGKNELQAQIEAYLLAVLDEAGGEIVKISPTWKPQTLNAMRRLERVLQKNVLTARRWSKESGYIYRIGQARIFFFSGSPEANIVGATASTLLEVDEAQDIEIAKFDKDIAPMAASTNATRVFWGTAWTSRTLLARELRAGREAEKKDGQRRVFTLQAGEVAAEVPEYGAFVAEQVARLGRNNPLVKTQFFSEEIDAEGGLFPPARVALMAGNHPPLDAREAGQIYCLLVDVAGEDEGVSGDAAKGELANPSRDATALTLVRANLATLAQGMIQRPTYEVVHRWLWVGKKQTQLYAEVQALFVAWDCRWLVGDATGVGAGLLEALRLAFGARVIPFTFNAATKSQLGWDFTALVDAGRFKDHAPDPAAGNGVDPWHQAEFYNQLSFCQFEILPGPAKAMRWGVPDGTRDPATGELVHDDLVLSAALCAVLDRQEWRVSGAGKIVQRADPVKEMDRKKNF